MKRIKIQKFILYTELLHFNVKIFLSMNVYEEEAVKLHAFLSSVSMQLHGPVGLPADE